MKTLIKKAQVIYPGDALNKKQVDILVNNGVIEQIGDSLSANGAAIIEAKELLCFPSLVDMQCSIGEPGLEYKESLESAAKAAKAGGFSHIVMLPNTSPVLDNKAQLHYIAHHSSDLPVNILTYGAISKNIAGEALSEMYDMHHSSAVGFSDGKRPIDDVNLMKRALEYARTFGGMVCSFPNDQRVAPGGMVHESVSNTQLGIKSTPALAEELMLNRDIYLLEYTRSKLHVSTLSSAGSVALVAEAKKRKLRLSAGVALANLLYTDDLLQGFDANYKTNPPLREQQDRNALVAAINDGSIDVICTDHTPENIENKEREFDHAEYGMTMLETALPLINMHLKKDLKWHKVIQAMSLNPRVLIGLPAPALKKGEPFDFTLFAPHAKWVYNKSSCKSKSHNSPVFGQELTGQVLQP